MNRRLSFAEYHNNIGTSFPMVVVMKYEESGYDQIRSYEIAYGFRTISEWREYLQSSNEDYENSLGMKNTHSFFPVTPENVSHIIEYVTMIQSDEYVQTESYSDSDFQELEKKYSDMKISL